MAGGLDSMTGACFFAALVSSLGSGFQHGYNTGILNNINDILASWTFTLTHKNESAEYWSTGERKWPDDVSWINAGFTSGYVLGGMIGGLSTKLWIKLWGLKFGIILNNIWCLLGTLLLVLSVRSHLNSWILLIVGRIIIGINSGLNAGLVPMYLSEIPPIPWRGTIGSMYQLFITISISLAQILSTNWILGTDNKYQFLFYPIAVIALLQMSIFCVCVDSPKYLYDIGKEEEARKALIWLRGVEEVEPEMEELKKSNEAQKALGKFNFSDIFKKPEYRIPLLISCALMVSQQFSGINAIIFYSTNIFKQIKIKDDTAMIGTLCIGVVNVLVTIVSVLLVDRLGRRTLLLFAFIALFLDTLLFSICSIIVVPISERHVMTSTIAPDIDISTTVAPSESPILPYTCIALAVLFIIFFASGAGSIPWFLISELFLQEARPVGSSIAVFTNWAANFAVGLLFPIINDKIGPFVWLIFTSCLFISVVYMIFFIPETKNRPVEDIVAAYRTTPKETFATPESSAEAPAP